jgi:hypothetical protein
MFKKKYGVVLLLIIAISGFSISSVYADADRGHIYYDQIKFHFYSYSSGAHAVQYYLRLSEKDSNGNMQSLARATYESDARGDVFIHGEDDNMHDILNDPNNVGKTYYIDAFVLYMCLAKSHWSSGYTEVVLGEDREVNIASDTYLGDFPDITTYATTWTYLNPKQQPKLIIDNVSSTDSAKIPIKAVDESGNPARNLKINVMADMLNKTTVASDTLITNDQGYVYFDFKPEERGTYCIIAFSNKNGDYIPSLRYWNFVYIN